MSAPLVYLILGCKGTGRFQVVSDLIEFGTAKDDKTLVFHSTADAENAEANLKLKSREAVVASFEVVDDQFNLSVAEGTDLVFVVADGLTSPADSVEAFHGWLGESSCELGRVITVLHSELAIENKKAAPWFECCIHYSDVILLAKREKVNNKLIKSFQDGYADKCYPCLFQFVKKGRVSNPSLILSPEPRRITRIFDIPEVFEDDDPEDIFEEETAGNFEKDIYQNRITGGRRELVLPEIAEYL